MADSAYSDNLLYVLPPDFEKRDPHVYGYFYITIGKLLWIRNGAKPDNTKLRVKFWGDRGQGQLMRPTNSSRELGNIPTSIKFEIRCPIQHFHKYLQDSTKIKIFVLDPRNDKPIGVVTVNVLFYLKHG